MGSVATLQITEQILKALGQSQQAEWVGWLLVAASMLFFVVFAVRIFWRIPTAWYEGKLRMLQVRKRLRDIQ